MASVSIYINESYVNLNNESALYLRVYINNKYIKIPLKIHAKVINFDKDKGRIKGVGQKNNNLLIKEALGRAADIILKYKVNRKELTKDLFIKEFSNPSYFTDFYKFMERKIKERKNEITETTQKQHFVQLRKLQEFKKELALSEITESFLKEYENWLLRKRKNGINTTHNALKTLKTYIKIALKEKLITENPFEFFKMKKEKKIPEFLDPEERNKLFDLYNQNTLTIKLQNTLRWFLFGCYTGLRISDIRSVTHEQIRNNLLQFRPFKTKNTTNKVVSMPLHVKALKLITDENPLRIQGKLFNCYSSQKMNEYIKEIVKKVGITKKVSFHMARHTFASLLLKSIQRADGILILKELLGHANIESTLIYTHVLDDDIRNAIENFD